MTRITRNVAELFQKRLPRHGTCNLPFRREKVSPFPFPANFVVYLLLTSKSCFIRKKKLSGSTPTVFSTILTKRKSANQRGAPCAMEFYAKIPRLRLSLPALWWGEWWLIFHDLHVVLFFMIFLIQPPNMYGMSAVFLV